MGLALAVVAAIAASYGLGRRYPHSQTGGQTGRRVLYYVDPMHPAYKSDKPGIAPDCGMQLEPVYAEDAGNAPPSSPLAQLPAGAVGIDGATQRLLGIRVAPVEKSGATRTIRVVGRVAPEDTRVYRVNSGDGRVYSRDLQRFGGSAGQEGPEAGDLLCARCFWRWLPGSWPTVRVPGAAGNDGARTVPFPGAVSKQGVGSLQGYTERLRNLGMSDVQIKRMSDSRQLPQSIDVVAPADGFILARNISAGQHFERGTEFYRIADLSKVWVVAEVYEQEAPYLRPGGQAQIALRGEGRQLPARITDSLPQSEAGGGTVKLRLEVDNPDIRLAARNAGGRRVACPSAARGHGAAGRIGRFRSARARLCRARRRRLRASRGGNRMAFRRTGRDPARGSARRARGGRGHLSGRFGKPAEDAGVRACARHRQAGCRERTMAAAKTATDPSCGMPVDPAKAAASGNTLAYRGATYYFCSKECKQKFQNNLAASAATRQGGADD